jgi:hypothetical protein
MPSCHRCTHPAQVMTTAGMPPTPPPRPPAAPTPPPSMWQVRGDPWAGIMGRSSAHAHLPLSADGSVHPSAELWSTPGQAGFGPMLGGSSPLSLTPGSGSVGGSSGFGSLHQHERMVGLSGGGPGGSWQTFSPPSSDPSPILLRATSCMELKSTVVSLQCPASLQPQVPMEVPPATRHLSAGLTASWVRPPSGCTPCSQGTLGPTEARG